MLIDTVHMYIQCMYVCMYVCMCNTCVNVWLCFLSGLCLLGASSLTQDRLLAGAEELQDLKGVWTELSKIWQKIDDMKEKPWITVAPRKIRQELEALLEQMKLMPNNLKTYSSYDYVLKMIKGYTKVCVGMHSFSSVCQEQYLCTVCVNVCTYLCT